MSTSFAVGWGEVGVCNGFAIDKGKLGACCVCSLHMERGCCWF